MMHRQNHLFLISVSLIVLLVLLTSLKNNYFSEKTMNQMEKYLKGIGIPIFLNNILSLATLNS